MGLPELNFCQKYAPSHLVGPFSLDGPIIHTQPIAINLEGQVDPSVKITKKMLTETAFPSFLASSFRDFLEMTLWRDSETNELLHYHLLQPTVVDEDSAQKITELIELSPPEKRAERLAELVESFTPNCHLSPDEIKLRLANLLILGITAEGFYANPAICKEGSLNTYGQWQKGEVPYRSWLESVGKQKYFEIVAGDAVARSPQKIKALRFISGVRLNSLFLPEMDFQIKQFIKEENLKAIREVVTPYIRTEWL